MPEGRGSTKSGFLGAVIVWAIGLAVSIGLGALTDMFLSGQALKSAVVFQQSALYAVSSFTPHRLIEQISLTTTKFPRNAKAAVPVAIAFIRELQARESALGVVPGSIFKVLSTISILSIAVGCFGTVRYMYSKGVNPGARFGMILALPVVAGAFGALAFTFLIVVVSLVLSLLKWTALAALFAFGGLTSLAGIFAMAGTVSSAGYFVVMKASEKRIGEAAERVASRLIVQK